MKSINFNKIRDEKLIRKGLRKAGLIGLSAALVTAYTPLTFAEEIGTGVEPTYDEAYYATLDYYGNLTEGSVVKSYTLNGFSSITDYGNYSEIINLTDDTIPKTTEGKTVFNFDKDNPPKHFYFEGKTSEPFDMMPWTISVSYELNGVPTEAEDLVGKTGVVDINLNIIPNETANDYAKNNYTLEAMTAFNQDDILSLEAEGAQIQLIGNIRAVLFAVLPGEEKHYTISVGTDSFTFSGLTFLMAPAKLAQIGMLSDLKEDKEEIENSYKELNSGIDALLDSVSGMTDSLNSAAAGLDELNKARQIIADGADEVADSGDTALDSLEAFKNSLKDYSSHIDTADTVIDRVDTSLDKVKDETKNLQSSLDDLSTNLTDIQTDMDNIKNITGTSSKSGSLQKNIKNLGDDIDELRDNLDLSADDLSALQIGVGGDEVTIQGKTISEIQNNFTSLENNYKTVGNGGTLSLEDFDTAMLIMSKNLDNATARATAKKLTELSNCSEEYINQSAGQYIAASQTDLAKELVSNYKTAVQLKTVYQTAAGNSKMNFKNFLWAASFMDSYSSSGNMDSAKKAADNSQKLYEMTQSGLLDTLASLCDTLGSDGLPEDLADITGVLGDTAADMSTTIGQSQDMITTVNKLIDDADDLHEIWKDNVPELKDTLQDTKNLLNNTTNLLTDTQSFMTKFNSLAKKVRPVLDSGTKNSLSSLSDVLRKAAVSTSSVAAVKKAKNNITDLLDKKWDEYTGEKNNILNMDPNADSQSLTSSSNDSPQTVQILIRTQEITEDSIADKTEDKESEEKGNFFSRVGNMFSDIWKAISNF